MLFHLILGIGRLAAFHHGGLAFQVAQRFVIGDHRIGAPVAGRNLIIQQILVLGDFHLHLDIIRLVFQLPFIALQVALIDILPGIRLAVVVVIIG